MPRRLFAIALLIAACPAFGTIGESPGGGGDAYSRYAGKYRLAGLLSLTVFQEEGCLHLHAPMHGSGPLEEISPGIFQARQGGKTYGIEFRQTPAGAITGLTINQKYTAKKVD